MRITFLYHSSFLVELEACTLLFDWYSGDFPDIDRSKPLYVFNSHHHGDHYSPEVFRLGMENTWYILGSCIRLSAKRKAAFAIDEDHVFRLGGGRTLELGGLHIETLTSTDSGVAFLIEAEGKTIYHAGDLHWWHWEGEPDPWNPDMARKFQSYAEPLRGRRVDLAMLPLDPRLGEAGFWGPRYFLELADIRHFLPMHQWKAYDFTDAFLKAYPQFADRTIPITGPGQVVTLGP